MRKRTKAREYALQVLYQADVTKDPADSALEIYWQDKLTEPEVKEFASELVKGTISKLAQIDELITKYAQNWQISRMALVDRNILRLGAYELLFREDIPVKVSINEAVELAKRYGDIDSGKFVNGVLDKIHKQECKRG